MTKIILTSEQLAEIACAVESKRDAVESGFYDDYVGEINNPEGDTREWADHLNDILDAITSGGEGTLSQDLLSAEDWQEIYYCVDDELQAVLGPDGENMIEEAA